MTTAVIPQSKFLGVCAFVADKLSMDVKGIRLLWVLATIFGFGSPVMAYFVIYVILLIVD